MILKVMAKRENDLQRQGRRRYLNSGDDYDGWTDGRTDGQVNLMYHPDAFTSLEDAFDPASNARYAARFLQQLYARTGTWPAAASGYHSLNAEFGGPYGRKVMAIWQSTPPLQHTAPPAPTPVPAPATQAVAHAPSPPQTSVASGAVPARIIPLPMMAGVGGGMTGRGLDSYRAMPTRLAFRVVPSGG